MFFKKFLEKRKEKREETAKKLREDFNKRLLSKIIKICNRVKNEYFETISRQKVINATYECFKELDYKTNIESESFNNRLKQFILSQTDWYRRCSESLHNPDAKTDLAVEDLTTS